MKKIQIGLYRDIIPIYAEVEDDINEVAIEVMQKEMKMAFTAYKTVVSDNK